MRLVFLLLGFSLIYTFSCQTVSAPSVKKEEKQAEKYRGVPERFDEPFEMERASSSIVLPDSFQVIEKSIVIVHLFINYEGEKKGFNILSLGLRKEDAERYVDISNAPKSKEMYPLYIQPFYPILEKEIEKIEIRKKDNVPIDKDVGYGFIIKYDLE